MLSKKGIVQLESQTGRIYLEMCILMRTRISPRVQYNYKMLERNSNWHMNLSVWDIFVWNSNFAVGVLFKN